MAAGSSDALQKQRSRQEEVLRTRQVNEEKQLSSSPVFIQEQKQDEKRSILRPDDALTAGFIEAASKKIGSIGADGKADGAMSVKYNAFCRSRKSMFFRQRQQWLKSRG